MKGFCLFVIVFGVIRCQVFEKTVELMHTNEKRLKSSNKVIFSSVSDIMNKMLERKLKGPENPLAAPEEMADPDNSKKTEDKGSGAEDSESNEDDVEVDLKNHINNKSSIHYKELLNLSDFSNENMTGAKEVSMQLFEIMKARFTEYADFKYESVKLINLDEIDADDDTEHETDADNATEYLDTASGSASKFFKFSGLINVAGLATALIVMIR